MKTQRVERRATVLSELLYALYGLLALVVATSLSKQLYGQGNAPAAIGLFVLLLAFIVWKHIRTARLLDEHRDELSALAAARGWQFGPIVDDTDIGEAFSGMSLQLLAKADSGFANELKSPDWTYADWRYSIYNHTKGGDYKAYDMYYGILSAKLPRVLPNVFFDSKSGRGRQFKASFAKGQQQSLEGNFDEYFDTYFAEDYTIDGLSFITPDVMEALIAASAYDIEIVQDRVLLYGPVYVGDGSLDAAAALIKRLQAELTQNAKTYKDERISGDQAWKTVTPLGVHLKRRGRNVWASTVIILIYLLLIFINSQYHR